MVAAAAKRIDRRYAKVSLLIAAVASRRGQERNELGMSKLRMTALGALLALLLAGSVASGALDVSAAGQHTKTHPTSARLARKQNHHGSGMTAHQHHARHARTHGQRKHHK
jgi:hypothetical protein